MSNVMNVARTNRARSEFEFGAILVHRAVRDGGGRDASKVVDMEALRGSVAIFYGFGALRREAQKGKDGRVLGGAGGYWDELCGGANGYDRETDEAKEI